MTIASAILLSCLAADVGRADESLNAPPRIGSPIAPPEAAPTPAVGGEMILNGDFENHTFGAGCHFNLPNASFNLGMSSATAFGDAEEIDVMADGTCDWGNPPQSGATKLGMSRQGPVEPGDAFSFDLSTSIVSGELYEIEFYAHAVLDVFAPDIGDVEIGISTSNTSFGTLVFSGTPSPSGWTLLSTTFLAPIDASYLTVRVQEGVDAWVHIDNFSLVPDSVISTDENTWGRIKSIYR
jgi:hypothetical protein